MKVFLSPLLTVHKIIFSSAWCTINPSYRTKSFLLANEPRHDVQNNVPLEEIGEEELIIQQRFREHQQQAPRLGFAADVRSLIQYNHGYAVMSTNSKAFP